MSDLRDAGLPAQITLVAGTGRSGTSWLGKLLDASPRVLYKHEPDNWARLPFFRGLPSRVDPGPGSEPLRPVARQALARAFRTHCLHFYRPPEFEKDFLHAGSLRLANRALRAADRVGLGSRVRLPLRPLLRREPHLVWKSVVSNLRLVFLHETFPDMRILLILRHPGGYVASWLRGARSHGWKGFGSRERLDDTIWPFPLEAHRVYEQAYREGDELERELIYWIVANETPLRALGEDPRVRVVVYEDLCADPERHVRAAYAHCGLPFGDEAGRFVRASTSGGGSEPGGYYSVFKDPARTAWAWREQLDPRQIDTIERYLGDSLLARWWR